MGARFADSARRWFEGGNPFSGSATSVASMASSKKMEPVGLTGLFDSQGRQNWPRATAMGKGCPVMASGGAVEVYETSGNVAADAVAEASEPGS